MLLLYFHLQNYHFKGGLIFMTAIFNWQCYIIHCFYFKPYPIKYFIIKNSHLSSLNFLFKEFLREEGSIFRWGRSPGVGNGNLLRYSCLTNSMDRGASWAIVHRIAKNQTQLSTQTHTHTHTQTHTDTRILA